MARMLRSICHVVPFCLLSFGSFAQVLDAQSELRLGIAAYENATYREAVEYLERAVSLDPTSTKAHLYLADAYNEGIVRIASSTQGKPPRSMITGVY